MPVELKSFFVGEETREFTEILDQHFFELADENGWNASSTKYSYSNDYRKRIIPYLKEINVGMRAFSEVELKELNDKLLREFKWGAERFRHMEYLFLLVYQKGASLGLYEDRLHSEIRKILNTDRLNDPHTISEKKKFYELKKSFTVEENIKIVRWLIALKADLKNHVGLDIGIAIMYLTGMRVNEACALMFSDFSKIPGTDIPSVVINKSTEIKSSVLKIGTKTVNGIRRIPVSEFLYELIQKKKKQLKAEKTDEDIEQMRIVKKADNSDAASADLSKRAKEVFAEIKVFSEERETALDIDLDYQKLMKSEGWNEKEASVTAYVMRRNFATMIHALALTDEEEQFIFGHVVEDDRRSYYNNSDRLVGIYRKLIRHPVYQLLEDNKITYSKEKEECSVEKPGSVTFSLFAKEPFEPISATIYKDGCKIEKQISSSTASREAVDNADIVEQLKALYDAEWTKFKEG